MSSANEQKNQHEPTAKHRTGQPREAVAYAAEHTTNKATKYPDGVFHSNGNLYRSKHMEREPKLKILIQQNLRNAHDWTG